MKFHFGLTKHPNALISLHDSYKHISSDNTETMIQSHYSVRRIVKYWYGISTKNTFFGVILFRNATRICINDNFDK